MAREAATVAGGRGGGWGAGGRRRPRGTRYVTQARAVKGPRGCPLGRCPGLSTRGVSWLVASADALAECQTVTVEAMAGVYAE